MGGRGRGTNSKHIRDQRLPDDVERWIASVHEAAAHDGDLYVHCLMGVGRSSMAVACILLARGAASSVHEAYELIRKQRPMVCSCARRHANAKQGTLERRADGLCGNGRAAIYARFCVKQPLIFF